MPETKKNKSNPVTTAKSSNNHPGEGAVPGSQRERWQAARTLVEPAQAEDRPEPPSRYDEWDEEMVLDFLTRYHALGHALVQAGFTRASQTPGSVLPNWEQFALHIEEQFDAESEPVLEGAVAYLSWNPKNLALRNARLEDSDAWETYSVENDMVWLAEIIQRIAHQVTHELNYMHQRACDDTQITAALFVVMAWAELDPEVARWLETPGTII
jgi:hypothetical protein